MKKLYSNFLYNAKMYIKYITKVGFGELFLDVLILLLIAVLASFAYVPVAMIEDILRSIITSFVSFNTVSASLFNALFRIVGACSTITLFVYLFNQRYDFKNEEVVPIKGTYTLKRNDEISIKERDKNDKKDEDVELPKVKEGK